jgi:hypothetical protein
MISAAPGKRDFEELSLHLPACAKPLRRRQGHF